MQLIETGRMGVCVEISTTYAEFEQMRAEEEGKNLV
jgi:hypothetical protein